MCNIDTRIYFPPSIFSVEMLLSLILFRLRSNITHDSPNITHDSPNITKWVIPKSCQNNIQFRCVNDNQNKWKWTWHSTSSLLYTHSSNIYEHYNIWEMLEMHALSIFSVLNLLIITWKVVINFQKEEPYFLTRIPRSTGWMSLHSDGYWCMPRDVSYTSIWLLYDPLKPAWYCTLVWITLFEERIHLRWRL